MAVAHEQGDRGPRRTLTGILDEVHEVVPDGLGHGGTELRPQAAGGIVHQPVQPGRLGR